MAFFGLCFFGLLIIGQAFRIQHLRGDYWISKSDSLSVRVKDIPAQRGDIMSSDGRLLATTLPTFDIRMDFRADGLTDEVFNNEVGELSKKLAQYFGDKSAASYRRSLVKARREGRRYHLIKRKVSYRTLQAMKTWPIWERGAYKGGMIVIEQSTRATPFGQLAHRTIGYERENAQSVGLEASFNDYLKGQKGKRLMRRIAGGTWIPLNDELEQSPINGKNVVTTIDVNVQDVTHSSLKQLLIENQAEWGTAIVMEVATGKIKALANLGLENGQYTEKYNYAVGNAGEPGSTMKLVTLAALLEDGKVSIDDSIDLNNGSYRLPRKTITDSEGWHPYRNVTIQKAFERSSNVGFTKLAVRHYGKSPKKFIKRLDQFGFDQNTGIEIAGEPTPFYRSPGDDGWSALSLPSISYGYEITMTPLQMLTFYNAIANDGKAMKPYLVESVSQHGQPVIEYGPTVIDPQLCSPETVRQLRLCLDGVLERGTGKSLASADYSAGGKTGTTKLNVPGYGYGKFYTASFAGYFPADKPKYSVMVVVNKPRAGKYYGGSVAGPVFKAVADMLYARSTDIHQPYNDTLTNRQMPKLIAGLGTDLEIIQESLSSQNADFDPGYLSIIQDSTRVKTIERENAEKQVPNVVDMGLDDAIYLLENAGLKVRFTGKGRVRTQSLSPGTAITDNQIIELKLAR